MTAQYVGTGTLAKLSARRDRIRLPVWVYAIVALVASTAYAFKGLYTTVAQRIEFADQIRANGALVAVTGRIFDDTTIGGLTAWRFGGFASVLAALMSVLTVVRHTRAEEDSGRTELVSAAVVGRRAPLTAALTVAAYANVLIALLIGVVMVAFGQPAISGFALGLSVAGAGLTFAGIAAVTAQIASSSRTATGLALALLGLAFVLRAAGDVSTGGGRVLSWLSPIGWAQQVRAYAGERWWVFALFAGLTAVLIGLAYTLVGRRDVGAGLIADRPGAPRASRALQTSLGLAVRLQRGMWIGWAAGLFVLGLFLGSAGKNVGDLLKTSSQMTDYIEKLGGSTSATNAYFVATIGLFALAVAAYGITAVLRARTEETDGRAENLLATRVTRAAYLRGHVLVALVGSALILVAMGLGAGISYSAVTGDAGRIPSMIGAALGQWPAVAVFAGVAVLLFGFAPRLLSLAWAAFGVAVGIGQIGPLLKAPQWVLDWSPFTHSPKLPGGAVTAMPLVVLTAIAAALVFAGVVGFRRRDVG